MSLTTIRPTAIQATSTEFVYVVVQTTDGGLPVDPTANIVTMAFKAGGAAPVSGDFKSASWETDLANPVAPVYLAKCLVGPGGGVITLTPDRYKVYVKVVDAPETPVLKAPEILVVEDN